MEKKLVLLLVKPQPTPPHITQEMKIEKHNRSVEKVRDAMVEGRANIVVTNSSEGGNWDANEYVQLADAYGYTTYILDKENNTLCKLENVQ